MGKRSIEEELEDELNIAVESMLRSGGHEDVLVQQEETKVEPETEEEPGTKVEPEIIDVPQKPQKPKKKYGFIIFLTVYVTLLVGLIAFGLYYVWNLLIDYEAGMPDVQMTKILEQTTEQSVLDFVDGYLFEISEFDTIDSVKAIYQNILDGQELVFKRDETFRNEAPVYQIMAGETRVLTVTLKQSGVNGHGFAIWERGEIRFNEELIPRQSISVRVPKDSVVLLNGIPVSDEYLRAEEDVPLGSHIEEYVETVPKYQVYQMDGLIQVEQVLVNNDMVPIVMVEDEEYDYSYAFATDDSAYSEISGVAMDIAHSYATYLINKGNLSVAHSRSIGTARKYLGSMDTAVFYLWNEEYTYEFSDESVSNVIRYSEDCISCDTSYVLTVRYRLNRSIEYHTCIHGMYIKKDGIWYLADFELEDTKKED